MDFTNFNTTLGDYYATCQNKIQHEHTRQIDSLLTSDKTEDIVEQINSNPDKDETVINQLTSHLTPLVRKCSGVSFP